MLWLVLAPLALAEEVLVPFQPPDEVPLPTRAEWISGRFRSDASTCHHAAIDALRQLRARAAEAGLPHVIRLAERRDSRDLSIRAECKDRHAGKEVVGKSIELLALASAGSDDDGWPTLSGDRAANLLWALSDLTGVAPDALEIDTLAGTPALVYTHEHHLGATGLELDGRAAWVLEQHVFPPITRWARVLEPYPELGGVLVVTELRSQAAVGREKRRERFRVVVRTADALSFLEGRLTEQQLARKAGVFYRPSPKVEVEVPLVIDLDAAWGQVARPVPIERRAPGVDDDDIEILTDDIAP